MKLFFLPFLFCAGLASAEDAALLVPFGVDDKGMGKKIVAAVQDANATASAPHANPEPEKGRTIYYYFRGEQTNGELVWVSPMWITLE